MAVEATIIGLVDRQVVMAAWGTDLEADKREGAQFMTSLEECILISVVDTAELDTAEVLNQILLTHEESSVVFIRPPSSLLGCIGPAVGVIAPVALPLEVTPWVPQLVESHFVAEAILDHYAANQAVGMVSDEAELLKGINRGGGRTSRGRHDPVALVSDLDTIPERFIASLDDLGRGTSQVTQDVLSKTSLDTLVTAMKFGPGFFEQDHPELISVGLGEGRLISEARDKIIDNDLFPLTILADFQAIDAQIVLLIVEEELRDASGYLREH